MDKQDQTPVSLGIVVVNYGSHSLLEQNLAHVTSDSATMRIVVVDNFYSDQESNAIAALAADRGWILLANEHNRGFGSAVNQGVEHARALGCSVFLLVNPDVSIQASVVETLYRHCVAEPMVMVTPRIVRPGGEVWFAGGTLAVGRGRTSTAPGSDSSGRNGWLTGACLAVHSELWRAAGGFDEDYFLYWEDLDLSWRCVAAGGRLVVLQDVEAVHSVGGTQTVQGQQGVAGRGVAGQGKSAAYVYYNCRNRLLFAAKHLGRHDTFSWLVRSPAYATQVLLRGGPHGFVRNPSRFFRLASAALRGTFSGSDVAIRSLIS